MTKPPKHLCLKVKRFELAKVHEHPDNPRVHPPAGTPEWAALRKSLEESYFDSMVVNVRGGKNVLVSGHYRRKVMLEMGVRSADMVVVDWDEPTHKARMLAANELLGKFDDAKLMELLKSVQTSEIDQSLTGFTDERLKELLEEHAPETLESDVDAEPQIDRADELRKKWGVSKGQIWQCGDHRLMAGDCEDESAVGKLMGDDRAALVFTDPPYGVAIGAKNRMLNSFQPSGRNLTDIVSDQISATELKKALLAQFKLTKRFCAEECAVFVCSPQGGELGMMMMMMMMMEAGLEIRHVLNWVKNAPTFSMGRLDYDYQHEPILYTWTKTHKRKRDGQFQTSIWSVDKPRKSPEHPTMKPVELPVNAILNHTDQGDVCYEPYSGSGTMLIACERTQRKCRAMEIAPEYVSVALQRWADATGKTPVLL